MDCLMNNEILVGWLTQYGAISLFVLLIFGIIALPIPEETLMVLSGILIKKGGLYLMPTLTAGYLGHAATIASSKVFNAFLGDKYEKAFMHGPTFMGNPLACAVALKGIEIFERENYLEKISAIESTFKTELKNIFFEEYKFS